MDRESKPKKANLCVFCGASMGVAPSVVEAGEWLGGQMASEEIGLVYGGGHVGIMGVIADAVLKRGGVVQGVIPKTLVDLEVAHSSVTELVVVDTMHERKQIMYEASQAFLIFPGGIGTLDEFFEIWTWKQLRYHRKPIFVYNHKGFYTHLLLHLEHIVKQGFFAAADFGELIVEGDLQSLWRKICLELI